MSLWTQFRDNILIPLNPVAVWTYKHLLKKPSPLAPNYAQQTSPQMFKAEITPQKIIYGNMRISGPLYRVGSTGANHMYSHIIIPLAGHELDSIGNIYVNTKLIDGTATLPSNPTPAQQWRYDQDVLSLKQYANHVRVTRHTGAAGQVVDPQLLAELDAWKSTNIGTGIAYLYVRFKFSAALFPNGIENVQADVRGAKVFDPRTVTAQNPSGAAPAWSDNWALCMRDYLTADYGMGLTSAEVNDAYTIASADISQQVIPTANAGSQNRYTLNGVIDTKNKVTDNIKKMLTAGAGHIVPVIEGQCRIIAGAYPAAGDITVTVTESDVVSDIDYQPHSPRNSLFNTVTGSYSGEESGWKKLTYPQVGDAAAVIADGRVIRKVIDLPYSTDHERCQRLSKLVLNQHRASAVLKFSCKATVKEIAVMEVINVQLPALWASTKTFRVMDFTNKPDFTVDLVLHEDNAAIYDWQQADAAVFIAIPPQVINTGAAIVQPGLPVRVNGLELNGQGNNTVFTGGDAHFVWRHTTTYDFQNIGSEVFGAGSGGFDAWFMGYEITVLDTAGNIIRTDFTKDNWYDFTFLKNAYITGGPFRAFSIEVRIKGQQNQLSLPAKLNVSNPAPALPTALNVRGGFKSIEVSFHAPTDLDYAGVEVYASTVSGFTPSAANLAYEGNASSVSINDLNGGDPNTPRVPLIVGTTYYLRIRPFDLFSRTGLNETSELSATTVGITSADADTTPPTVPGLVTLTTGLDTNGLNPTSWVKAVWGVSTDNGMLANYIMQYWTDVDVTRIDVTATGTEGLITPTVPGRTYFVQVAAVDWAGNTSAFNTTQSITAAGDTLAPTVPTGLAGLAGLDKVIFSWVNPTTPNFLLSRVYVGTTAGFVPSAANLKYEGLGNTFILDQVVAGTTYYAKISSVSVSGVPSAFSAVSVGIVPLKMTAANAANYIANAAIGNAQISTLDAGKITTGFLSAGRIDANTITAAKLSVTKLDAISADLGQITAGTITGSVVQTSGVLNTGLKLSAAGIEAFNATNQRTAHIAPSGDGYLGLVNPISWNAAGVVSIPGSLVVGSIAGQAASVVGQKALATLDFITNTQFHGDLVSSPYQVGVTGWKLTRTGNFEANNGTFRGAIYASSITLTGTAALPYTKISGSKPPSNADKTQTIIDGGVVTTGCITLSNGGNIKSGKATYADTLDGFWQGSDGGIAKMKFNGANGTLDFDGTNVTMDGVVLRTVLAGSIPLVARKNFTRQQVTNYGWDLYKEFTIAGVTGTITVTAIGLGSGSFTSYMTVGKNGAVDAAYVTVTGVIGTKTRTYAVLPGDRIQLWGLTRAYTGPIGLEINIQSFTVSCDKYIQTAETA